MGPFGRMISTTASGGMLSSFSIETGVDISHLLFANDTLIFCGADPNHLRNLRGLFLCFEVVSSLKTNLDKVRIVSCW
jgi:hypothetical protein